MTEREALDVEKLKSTMLETLDVALSEIQRLHYLCGRAADALAYEMTGRHSQLPFRDWSDLIAELRKIKK